MFRGEAGCVEPLATNKAELLVLWFWQRLGWGAGSRGPGQLQLVSVGRNTVCKAGSHSLAGSVQYFENIQLVIIDIHILGNALKEPGFWLLLKTSEDVVVISLHSSQIARGWRAAATGGCFLLKPVSNTLLRALDSPHTCLPLHCLLFSFFFFYCKVKALGLEHTMLHTASSIKGLASS